LLEKKMSNKKDKVRPPAPQAGAAPGETAAPAEGPAPETAPEAFPAPAGSPEQLAEVQARAADLEKQLAEAQSQAAEYKDGWQRAVAELQNYRRRTEREQAESYQTALGSIIKRYLTILDDLERALAHRPADLPWADGIELIYRKLQTILENEGLKRIEAEGRPFDPNFHEAIAQEPAEGMESGTVIGVVQHGYMLGERVIRPAMVRVAQ
jgi:molecular chaperone GrpE